MEEVEVMPVSFGGRLKGLLVNWRVWVVTAVIIAVLAALGIMGKANAGETLGGAVDLFSCCILTWKAIVIVLPAFLAAGAIVTFVPDSAVVRYLGRQTSKWKSYSIGSVTGILLSVCSCNVVPIFMGILRRGAGIGPAYAFVYAAPAINIVTIIMVLQVIGPEMAIARTVAVPIIAIVGGMTMAILFRKEDIERQKQVETAKASSGLQNLTSQGDASIKRSLIIVTLILSVLLFGAWDSMGDWIKLNIAAHILPAQTVAGIAWFTVGIVLRVLGALLLMGGAVWLAIRWYSKEEAVEWAKQTGILLKTVLPIFIPAVLAIAVVINYIPIQWMHPTAGNPNAFVFGHPNGNRFPQILVSSIFGSLMYFPLLTEVAFVKGLLKHDLAVGPALAILLAGPGLSLPGLILLNKVVGLRKTLVYFVVMTLLVATISFSFGRKFGPYLCACQQMKTTFLGPKTPGR